MTEPREIMAAALQNELFTQHPTCLSDEHGYPYADAALAALTAAGFAVRRTVEREALRERIAKALQEATDDRDGWITRYSDEHARAVADAVLDAPTEEGNG